MKENRKLLLILTAILAILFFAYRSYLKRNPSEINLEQDKDYIDKFEDVAISGPLEKKSEYEGNSLDNGSSPFNPIYGKGLYRNTQHSLKIRNQGNIDVIIFLVSLKDNKVIRNEYVKAHSVFDLTKIPNSVCYVKFYYGKNWNPIRKTKNIVTGGFDNEEQHIISSNEEDIFEFKEDIRGDYIYSSNYQLTLETIIQEGNVISEKRVEPSDFF